MTSLPYWEKGANKFNAVLVYEDSPKRVLVYSGKPNIVIPRFRILFSGIPATNTGTILTFQRLATALQMAGQYVSKLNKRGFRLTGKPIPPSEEKIEGVGRLFGFPIFAKDQDRAVLYGKVYVNNPDAGSVEMWLNKVLVLEDLPSIAQFSTVCSYAVDYMRKEMQRSQ